MIETKNAIIRGTMLGPEDHGILTCSLTLDYGDSCQGFGGYSFDNYDEARKVRIGSAWGMEFINRLLQTLRVSSWEKLPGTHCRVRAEFTGVHAIGHIIENRWFDPKADLAFLKPEAK